MALSSRERSALRKDDILAWRRSNPDKLKAYNQKYYAANKEKENARSKAYREDNPDKAAELWTNYALRYPDKIAAGKKVYREGNRDKVNADRARYDAAKLKASPEWADKDEILKVYTLARDKTKLSGTPWHVDHIVPLRSKLVCGLHCEYNLRVIPGIDNIFKGNRHWPDMP